MTDATATRQPTRAPSAWRRRPAHDHRHDRASTEEPSWQQRYEQVLQANERLHEKLRAQEEAHRKSLTVVKYEPSLPNNDVFTKELVDENRQLIARYRVLELKLARIENGQLASAASSPRRSVDKSRVVPTRKKGGTRTGFPLKHASVQTDGDARGTTGGEDDTTTKQSQQREAATAAEAVTDEEASQAKAPPVDVQFLVTELKQRLTDLDVDLMRLRGENELLRMEMMQVQHNGNASASTQRMDDLHAQLRTKEQQQELEHLLHDRIRQMKILEEQFTHFQHKVKTKSLLYKESLGKIEQLHAELFDAKQTMLKQAEWLHAQEDRNLQLTMLEKEVHVLRSENAKLNDTVGMLSARPLDALNVQLEKKALEVSLLDDEKRRLESELKKASQDHRIVMQTNDKLRGRVDTLTKQIDAQLVEVYELKRVCEQSAADREIAELQLQFYLSGESAESKQLMEAVGRALKSMQREESGVQDDTKGDGSTNRCAICNHKRQEPTSSLYQERIEKMTDISRLIQDDTRAQLQDMRVAHQAEVHALRRQCKRWEQRANEYLKEIAMLQKEHTEFGSTLSRHGTTKVVVDSPRALHGTAPPGDVGIETLMSVRVFDLRFTPHSHSQDESTVSDFVVFCDYFDFEPQHSPVFELPKDREVAALDLEISYKLHVDRGFCMSPLATAFNVELHKLRAGSAAVVGVVSASLQSLFIATDGNSALLVKILDPITRVPIGSVRIALSLDTSTSHLFKAWRQVDSGARFQTDLTPGFPTRGLVDVPQAVLSVRVIGLVLTKDMAQSSATEIKLRYRFMGNPTVRCSVKKATKQAYHGLSFIPVDHAKQFAIPADQHFLEFLSRHEMGLQVKSDASGGDGNAVVAFRRHSGADWNDLVSAVITKGDPGTERTVGRIWMELQVDGLTEETKLMDPQTARRVIEGVFGSQNKPLGPRQVAWRRFCGAISLSSVERAVRGMLSEKLSLSGNRRPSLRLTCADDTLSLILERCGVRLSRTELSFISGVLLPTTLELEEDEAGSTATYWQSINRRLELIETTMHSEWLQIEHSLRRHIAAMDVVVDYGGEADEHVDWETFAYRIRLAPFNRK